VLDDEEQPENIINVRDDEILEEKVHNTGLK
jgi:hypothetical protein